MPVNTYLVIVRRADGGTRRITAVSDSPEGARRKVEGFLGRGDKVARIVRFHAGPPVNRRRGFAAS